MKRITKRFLSLLLAAGMVLPGLPTGQSYAAGIRTGQRATMPVIEEDLADAPAPEVGTGVSTKGAGLPVPGGENKMKTTEESRLVQQEDQPEAVMDRPGSEQIVDFMVVLEKAPLLDAFTPAQIRERSEAVEEHIAVQEQMIQAVQEQLTLAFGEQEGFKLGYSHTLATTSVAVTTRYGNRSEIEAMEGVDYVYVAPSFHVASEIELPQEEIQTSNASGMIGADDLNTQGYTGKGMKIAIIDTGIVVEHPSFRKMDQSKLTRDSLTEEDVEAIFDMTNAGKDYEGRILAYESNKLPFVFNYYGRNFDVSHATADHDHGTHVAGIAAANQTEDSEVVGIAPDAQIIVLQVFSPGGGADWSTILSAMEDCVLLGVDTANLSLGSAAGFTDGDKAMNEVLARFENTETNIIIAGGNDTNNAYMNLLGTDMSKVKNIDNGLIGTPATAPAAISVASAENDGAVLPYVTVDGMQIGFTDTAISPQTGFLSNFNNQPKDFVVIEGVGDAGDYEGKEVSGKIAVVERGELSFQDKQKFAKDKGAVGLIVYNNVAGNFSMQISDGEGHIPAVSITREDGLKLKEKGQGQLHVCEYGQTIKVKLARTMSDFSSWGITPDLKLKPEITGVGGNILSARDPSIYGSDYGNMSGTSMASPQVAGAMTVLQEYLRRNEKLEARSLRLQAVNILMSTASQLMENGIPYSPRNQGAGLVDLGKAIQANAYFTAPSSWEGRPKGEMGDDHTKEGKFSFEFMIHNISDAAKSYTFSGITMTADVDSTGEYMTNTTKEIAADITVKQGAEVKSEVTVPANGSIALTAEISLKEDAKNFIDEHFPYGGFVEGYLYAQEKGKEVKLSMPFLGFYGDWSDSPIFDDTGEEAALQAPTIKTRKGRLGQNPYIMGGKAGDKYNAISQANPIEEMIFGMMRNSRRVAQRVTSQDGLTEYFSWSEDYITKTHYNTSYGVIIPYNLLLYPELNVYIWEGKDKDGNAVADNTRVTYTVSSYLDDGDDKVDDVYSFDLVMDNQKPTVENADTLDTAIIKDKDKGTVKLPITMKDNHYIAAVVFEDMSGQVLGKYEVNNQPGEPITVEYDVTGFGTDFKVIVGDYAANENVIELSLDLTDMPVIYPEPIALDKDRIYGYETYTDGYVNMGWFSAEKENFSNLRNETYSDYDNVISVAEYINGYVVGQRYRDGALMLFTPYSSYWHSSVIWDQGDVGTTAEKPGAILFYDMTMDYSTDTLYASGWKYLGDNDGDSLDDGKNSLFKIDLTGSEVEVTEVAPFELATNSFNVMTLACTTEGDMYGITSDAKLYEIDKANGDMTEVGATGFEKVNNYAGCNVIQSMTYDHNIDEMYWYAHSQVMVAGVYVNVGGMYKVNLESGEATYVGASGNSGYTSLFIPSDEKAENIQFRVDPTELEIQPKHLKIAQGQSKIMSVEWKPWNALPVAISWSTEDEEIATVNANGKVTAVKEGETTLKAEIKIGEETKTFESTIEVVKSAKEMYGFVITDFNGNVGDSSWITYADSNMKDITTISGPGGMIQGGTYYNEHIYYVVAEQIPFEGADTKVYKAKVNKGATNKETTITNPELIHTLEGIELGNLGFDYNTGRMYAIDYTNQGATGGLVLLDIDYGTIDHLGTFNGDLSPMPAPAMCVTKEGNIVVSDMFGNLYQVNPDTMYATKIASIGTNSFNYAAMTYDYNTGNIYWNPCMGEGNSDFYMVVFDEEKDQISNVEIIPLGGVGGDKGMEQTVLFTIPDEEPDTTYIPATKVEITNADKTKNLDDVIYLEGGTMQLNTVTTPARPSIKPRKWESSDSDTVEVDQNGVLKFKKEGTAEITVTVENKGENPDPVSVTDTIHVTVHKNAGEFLAFLNSDQGSTGYYDFWLTMKDYEIDKSKVGTSMIGTYSLRSGEYYDGYVYGYNDADLLYRIDAKNFNNYVSIGTALDQEERIINMTMDYTEGIMYGINKKNELVTIELTTGTVEKKADLTKKVYTIAADNLGTIYGVGAETYSGTAYLYTIDTETGACTQVHEFNAEDAKVYVGEDYYFERMYAPQMTFDHGTNRLYLNATVHDKNLNSYNQGFILIQLEDAKADEGADASQTLPELKNSSTEAEPMVVDIEETKTNAEDGAEAALMENTLEDTEATEGDNSLETEDSLSNNSLETEASLSDNSLETKASLSDNSLETKAALSDNSLETKAALSDKAPETEAALKDKAQETLGGEQLSTRDVVKESRTRTAALSNTPVRSNEETGSEEEVKQGKTIKYVANLGNPSLEIKGTKKAGEMFLALLCAIPEPGEIKATKVTAVTVNREKARVEVGKSTTLTASVMPSDLDSSIDKSVTWSSADTTIASVDASTGVVTGVAAGTVEITATSKNNTKAKAVCEVTVVASAQATSNAYTISGTKGKIFSFNPELPASTEEEISSLSGGGNVIGMAMRDADNIYYLTKTRDEGVFPILHLYNLKTKSSKRIAPLRQEITDASDIAYDSKNDLLYVAAGFYIYQYQPSRISVGSVDNPYSLRMDSLLKEAIPYASNMQAVTVVGEDVYFVGSANQPILFKTDDKFKEVVKLGELSVNTVDQKCELAYDSSTETFYLTDAGDRIYSFKVDENSTEESKIKDLKQIDILGEGIDINGLAIWPQ